MTTMTITQFGTDAYGAQLSLKCDLDNKSMVYILLVVFNGKKETEEFTDFAAAVDAYNAFVAGTRLTDYGKEVRDTFFAKCKEYAEANPEKFPDLDTTKRFPICGFNEVTKDAKDVAGTYLNDLGHTVSPLLILPDYIHKAQHPDNIVCFRGGNIEITYKEVIAELERCFIQEADSNE